MGYVRDIRHCVGESARDTRDATVPRRQCAKNPLDLLRRERGNFGCKRRVGELRVGLEGRWERWNGGGS